MNQRHIAVIGTGYWGRNLVRNFHALGVLRTVCDNDPEVLRKIVEQCEGVQGVSSFAEVLSDTHVGAVVIATPAVAHANKWSKRPYSAGRRPTKASLWQPAGRQKKKELRAPDFLGEAKHRREKP